MTREQIWLGILTVLVLGTVVGGVVALSALRADLDLLDRQVAGGVTGDWGVQPTAPPETAGNPTGRIDAVAASSDTLSVTLSVRLSGPADLLFEPPVLRSGQGTYHPTQDSLERVRFAFLDLVGGGQARATFVFHPAPVEGEKLALVFNPNQQPSDPVSPRWELVIRSAQ
jgi:hypothetical protein